jgi:hypothetical protein
MIVGINMHPPSSVGLGHHHHHHHHPANLDHHSDRSSTSAVAAAAATTATTTTNTSVGTQRMSYGGGDGAAANHDLSDYTALHLQPLNYQYCYEPSPVVMVHPTTTTAATTTTRHGSHGDGAPMPHAAADDTLGLEQQLAHFRISTPPEGTTDHPSSVYNGSDHAEGDETEEEPVKLFVGQVSVARQNSGLCL